MIYVEGDMRAHSAVGKTGNYMKGATGWLTSHPALAAAVGKTCPGISEEHPHEPIESGSGLLKSVYTEMLANRILDATVEIAIERGDERYARNYTMLTQHQRCDAAPDGTWYPAGDAHVPISQILHLDMDRSKPAWEPILAELDARVEVLASAIAANSPGAIAAYKDLYRIAENTSLADGLDYETTSEYDIPDAATRFAAFVAKLSEKG